MTSIYAVGKRFGKHDISAAGDKQERVTQSNAYGIFGGQEERVTQSNAYETFGPRQAYELCGPGEAYELCRPEQAAYAEVFQNEQRAPTTKLTASPA